MSIKAFAFALVVVGAALPLQSASAQAESPAGRSTVPTITTPRSPNAPASTGTEVTTSGTVGSTSVATPAPNAGLVNQQMRVDALRNKDLVTASGTKVGDIEGIVESNADKKQFVLVGRGGFLGFGAKEIAVPLDRVAIQSDKLVLRDVPDAEIQSMPEFKNENDAFRKLGDDQQISVAQH